MGPDSVARLSSADIQNFSNAEGMSSTIEVNDKQRSGSMNTLFDSQIRPG